MMLADFDAWAGTEIDAVETALQAWVPADAPAGLGLAMRYGVLDGGKRLRPLLVLAASQAVHGLPEAALRAACAVELIHAYSLVHDDMPCMDNDILRRGKPTVHVQFGEAQAILAADYDVAGDVWSATSYKSLRDEALECERWNRLHPHDPPRTPYVTQQFLDADGPIVAVSDFQKIVPDQIARFVPQPFIPLGTDGFGFSDVRESLRRHFEIDAAHIVVAVLDGLAQLGRVTADVVAGAIERFGIATETPDPRVR